MKPRRINFNRPAREASVRVARVRTFQVAIAASYLTAVVVLAGYLLVQQYLMQRALVVAQTSLGNVRGLENLGREALQVDPGFLDLMNQVSGSGTRWTPRLARLVELLPADAWIVGLQAGSFGMPLSDPRRGRMVIHVNARVLREDDKVTVPMRFVQTLQADSLFAATYKDIRFAATRTLQGNVDTVLQFDVECQ